jgi:hypothetical protein
MSVCMCSRCDRFEDTDFDIGEWEDESPYRYWCTSCVEYIADEADKDGHEQINGETFAQFVARMEALAPEEA